MLKFLLSIILFQFIYFVRYTVWKIRFCKADGCVRFVMMVTVLFLYLQHLQNKTSSQKMFYFMNFLPVFGAVKIKWLPRNNWRVLFWTIFGSSATKLCSGARGDTESQTDKYTGIESVKINSRRWSSKKIRRKKVIVLRLPSISMSSLAETPFEYNVCIWMKIVCLDCICL